MSDDKYPRVSRASASDRWYMNSLDNPSAPATHKVVPVDAIVIDRADLPEVISTGGGAFGLGFKTMSENDMWVGTDASVDPARYERWAAHHLALALRLQKYQAVDETQVAAIVRALRVEGNLPEDTDLRTMAESLYRAGVRVGV